ncbi:hypothetical protein GPZ74_09255 [Burkholderia pseudomallei]|nr:hypothetical protein [Burkholderia pseudomallei]
MDRCAQCAGIGLVYACRQPCLA